MPKIEVKSKIKCLRFSIDKKKSIKKKWMILNNYKMELLKKGFFIRI